MGNIHWQPIEDLPVQLMVTNNTELTSLGEIWKEQSEKLKESDVLIEFNEKLKREWAIETGLIERNYPFSIRYD